MPKLTAKPESIEVDLTRSAIVVVDMQNAFVSKGGTLDIAGIELSDAPRFAQFSMPGALPKFPSSICKWPTKPI
jgi:hypothetical protein